MQSVPSRLWHYLFSILPPQDLCHAALVSRKWNTLTSHETVWKVKWIESYQHCPDEEGLKALFRFEHELRKRLTALPGTINLIEKAACASSHDGAYYVDRTGLVSHYNGRIEQLGQFPGANALGYEIIGPYILGYFNGFVQLARLDELQEHFKELQLVGWNQQPMVLHKDEKFVLTMNGQLAVWDVEVNKYHGPNLIAQGDLKVLAVTKDCIVTLDRAQTIKIWDFELQSLCEEQKAIDCLTYQGDVFRICSEHKVWRMSLATRVWSDCKMAGWQVLHIVGMDAIGLGLEEDKLVVWDPEAKQEIKAFREMPPGIYRALRHKGLLVVGTSNGIVAGFSWHTGFKLFAENLTGRRIESLHMQGDRFCIAWTGGIRIFDLARTLGYKGTCDKMLIEGTTLS